MIECYNHTTITIVKQNAVQLALKRNNSAVTTLNMINGKVTINLDSYIADTYFMQFYDLNGNIIANDELIVHQNLKYAEEDYDHRSSAKQTLDAIQAYLAGRASTQQKRVKVGDKQIEYSSFDELIKWKNYYIKIVRAEQGRSKRINNEKIYVRGL